MTSSKHEKWSYGVSSKCNICFEQNGNIDQLFTLMPCGHGANTCKSCWINYLLHSTQTRACVNLKCMIFQCNEKVPSKAWDLLKFKSQNAYQRYKMFAEQDQNEVILCISAHI